MLSYYAMRTFDRLVRDPLYSVGSARRLLKECRAGTFLCALALFVRGTFGDSRGDPVVGQRAA